MGSGESKKEEKEESKPKIPLKKDLNKSEKIFKPSDKLDINLEQFINANKNENNEKFFINFKSRKKHNNEILKQINFNKLKNEKNLIKNKILFIESNKMLKISGSQIKNYKNNINLNIFLENIQGNLKEYLSNNEKIFVIEEIKEIFFQFNNILIKFFENENFINEFINFENIFYNQENNKLKIYYLPFEKNKLSPEKIIKKKNNKDKTNVWNLGLILYRLFEGKELKYVNKNKILEKKIKEEINDKYNLNNDLLNDENYKNEIEIKDLIKKCLEIDVEKRINIKEYFFHPFNNYIFTGKIEDKKNKNEFFILNVINLPKFIFNKLKLFRYEDKEIYSISNNFLKNYKNKKEEEEKQINLIRVIDFEKDKNLITNILTIINEKRKDILDLDMPFILFLYENPEIQIKINEIINKFYKIDNRFILYNKFSENENELELIEKNIYRAFSYYNECGDIFYLDGMEIDLRKKKFDFYFNIICISRSQMGKSTFINKYLSSFNSDGKEEIKAREGGNGRECSTKIALYYSNNIPITLIDIIGYNGEKDTVEKLNKIVREMSIVILQKEIHLILYFINFKEDVLFFSNEVQIFETLKKSVIRPKILFIRTKCKINIYKKVNDEIKVDLEDLNVVQKENINKIIYDMNNNFMNNMNIEKDKWNSVLNFLFLIENNNKKVFSFENVCFMNLKKIIDENGRTENDIESFGMDYFKFRMSKIFQIIIEEEKDKIEKWNELKKNLDSNNKLDVQKILKEIQFNNISTKFLSKNSNDIIKSLIDKQKKNININMKKFPYIINFFLCERCKKIHECVFIFGYQLTENENKELELTLNELSIRKILDDFIIYKIKCISTFEYFIQNIFQENQNSNDKQNLNIFQENQNSNDKQNLNISTPNHKPHYLHLKENFSFLEILLKILLSIIIIVIFLIYVKNLYILTFMLISINFNHIFKYFFTKINIYINNNINIKNDNCSEISILNTFSNGSNINLNKIVNNTKGIENNLNDCFIISIIQCLIHCKTFIEQLYKEKNIKNLKGITNEFIKICEKQTSNYIIDSLDDFKN